MFNSCQFNCFIPLSLVLGHQTLQLGLTYLHAPDSFKFSARTSNITAWAYLPSCTRPCTCVEIDDLYVKTDQVKLLQKYHFDLVDITHLKCINTVIKHDTGTCPTFVSRKDAPLMFHGAGLYFSRIPLQSTNQLHLEFILHKMFID